MSTCNDCYAWERVHAVDIAEVERLRAELHTLRLENDALRFDIQSLEDHREYHDGLMASRAKAAKAHLAGLQQALRTIRRYEMFVMLQGYDVRLDEAADGEVVKWSDLDAILKDTNE